MKQSINPVPTTPDKASEGVQGRLAKWWWHKKG
jgi:hypothetical protein